MEGTLFIKAYLKDKPMKESMISLIDATFGGDLKGDFEKGYINEQDYVPYSYYKDGKIIATASVVNMKFSQNGYNHNIYQVGSVAVAKGFKRKKLGRSIMEMVSSDYLGRGDGIFLYSDAKHVRFFKKCGFIEMPEYRYELKDCKRYVGGQYKMEPALRNNSSWFRKFSAAVMNSTPCSGLDLSNRFGLYMRRIENLDNVYYDAGHDAYAVIEKDSENDTVYLWAVMSSSNINLDEVIKSIPFCYSRLVLGFTPRPVDMPLFEPVEYKNENGYTLLFKGERMKNLFDARLVLPPLARL